MRARLLALLTVAAAALSACTGVPTSSTPETVRPVPLGGVSAAGPSAPPSGAAARDIVRGFLAANSTDPDTHVSARGFLTAAARGQWKDTTATIIDGETVGNYKPGKPVVVRGRVIATLSASGVYTPTLQGVGDGGAEVPFEFGIGKVNGEYRINSLRNGLVLTVDQFLNTYQQRPLYFFDLAERYLVPDPRWTALTDPGQASTWLLSQLADGPTPQLQNAVSSDTFPTQVNLRRLDVTVSGPLVRLEIPGAAQLDAASLNRLAAQVGRTLNDIVSPDAVLEITDGATPVRIPAAGGSRFTESGFSAAAGPRAPAPDLYYLRSGRIVDSGGRDLPGAVNGGEYSLTSIALSRSRASGALDIAGVIGTGTDQRLLVGTQAGGLVPTSLRGRLSRPAWAPARAEVWIGDGAKIYRIPSNGRPGKPVSVPVPSAAGGGRIVALRLSPEGSRLAVVIASGGSGAQQLFIGSIVRGAGQVRVDTLQQISPEGVVVTDVAWLESTSLFAIGYDAQSQDARIFETGSDGSGWDERGIGGLPDPPDSLTVTANQLAWVSVLDSVWRQAGSSWESPGITGQTAGTMPIYLE